MVGYALQLKKEEKPEWLEVLLKSSFFGPCSQHEEIRKNDMNVFCIDCKQCICQHCLSSSHSSHKKLLQIRRYVYHDVIRLSDMQKLLDCSRVQPYTINNAKVVFLNPRPQSRQPTKSNGGAFCEICQRNLTEPNRYCSIACKISFEEKKNPAASFGLCSDSFSLPEFKHFSDKRTKKELQMEESPASSLDSPVSCVENHPWVDSVLKPKKQVHKRKGIPRRAPVF